MVHETSGPTTAPTTGDPSRFGRACALVLILLAAAYLAVGRYQAEATAHTDPAQLALAVDDLSRSLAIQPDVHSVAASYVPGAGAVVNLVVESVAPNQVNAWLARFSFEIGSVVERLDDNEAVMVTIQIAGDSVPSRVVRVDHEHLDDPSAWSVQVVDVPANAFTVPGQSTTAGRIATAPEASLADPISATPPGTGVRTGTEAIAASTSALPPTTTLPRSTASTVSGTASGPTPVSDAASAASPAASSAAEPEAPPTTATPAAVVWSGLDDFGAGDANWDVLAGTWQVVDGEYHQLDAGSFDLISVLAQPTPADYTFEWRLRSLADSPLNAGAVLGLAIPGTREGGVLIDITDAGTYLRWGVYSTAGGAYQYVGGTPLATPLSGADWHTFTITVTAGQAVVSVDGVELARVDGIGAGSVGLVTSQATVGFDDVRLVG